MQSELGLNIFLFVDPQKWELVVSIVDQSIRLRSCREAIDTRRPVGGLEYCACHVSVADAAADMCFYGHLHNQLGLFGNLGKIWVNKIVCNLYSR